MVEIHTYTVSELANGTLIRRDIKRTGKVKHIICHQKVCYLLTDKSIILKTNLQEIRIDPLFIAGDPWRRKFERMCADVKRRKYADFRDLLAECNKGMELSPSRLEWYL